MNEEYKLAPKFTNCVVLQNVFSKIIPENILIMSKKN